MMMAVITDREVRVNTEGKPIMYTLYGPRPDQLSKRIKAGNERGDWVHREKKE